MGWIECCDGHLCHVTGYTRIRGWSTLDGKTVLLDFIVMGSACLVHLRAAVCWLCMQLKELNHNNVVAFIGACVEPGYICYLMQCCSRGTLQVRWRTHLVCPHQ